MSINSNALQLSGVETDEKLIKLTLILIKIWNFL